MAKLGPPVANPANTLGVVLAGGQGQRMGGVDKGLQHYQGQPLIAHALQCLRAQTWGATQHIGINANRNVETYAALGYPVWQDRRLGFEGPLQGMFTSMQLAKAWQGELQYLLVIPCDTPHLPLDLALRLSQALTSHPPHLAAARAGGRNQPLACLLSVQLMPELGRYLDSGQRKVQTWMEACGVQWVDFDVPAYSADAFNNFNYQADLAE